jgi:hypothetical protein
MIRDIRSIILRGDRAMLMREALGLAGVCVAIVTGLFLPALF